MSFDDILKSSVTRKKKEVKITSEGKEYLFFANEITYTQRVELSVAQHNGESVISRMIVLSITDKDGKHMTSDQANRLSDEHAEAFFLAASEVNKTDAGKN